MEPVASVALAGPISRRLAPRLAGGPAPVLDVVLDEHGLAVHALRPVVLGPLGRVVTLHTALRQHRLQVKLKPQTTY